MSSFLYQEWERNNSHHWLTTKQIASNLHSAALTIWRAFTNSFSLILIRILAVCWQDINNSQTTLQTHRILFTILAASERSVARFSQRFIYVSKFEMLLNLQDKSVLSEAWTRSVLWNSDRSFLCRFFDLHFNSIWIPFLFRLLKKCTSSNPNF